VITAILALSIAACGHPVHQPRHPMTQKTHVTDSNKQVSHNSVITTTKPEGKPVTVDAKGVALATPLATSPSSVDLSPLVMDRVGTGVPTTATGAVVPATSTVATRPVPPTQSPTTTSPVGGVPTPGRTAGSERRRNNAAVPPTTSPRRVETVPLTASPAGRPTSVEQAILSLWGPVEGPRAVRVARCESGGNPTARNGPNYGVMQINITAHAKRIAAMGYTTASMLEVGPNLAVAHAIWSQSGWRPWSCRP